MDYAAARARLANALGAEIRDCRVLEAMGMVPRERFVPQKLQHLAYEDKPLPIGLNQTISQPYIVALMTEALELKGGEKVLEVGTGSGYQAAILARLARRVVTTERLPELAESAQKLLAKMGCLNVEVHLAEETLGWRAEAPYDGIIVTAAAPRVPADLISQLSMHGRMVIPVGTRYIQELCQVTRHRKGSRVLRLGGCRFVSLIGKDAWDDESEGS